MEQKGAHEQNERGELCSSLASFRTNGGVVALRLEFISYFPGLPEHDVSPWWVAVVLFEKFSCLR